jgi:hypothetical protein
MKVIRSGGLLAQGQKHALEGIVEEDASLAWKAMFSMIGYNRPHASIRHATPHGSGHSVRSGPCRPDQRADDARDFKLE